MKKLLCLILLFTMIMPIPVSAKTPAVFLYVSQSGDDSACGTIDEPLKTLSAAIELAEGIGNTVVINIRGGTYQMTDTIKLGAENSNLVIRAYNNEKVSFTGGVDIPVSAFSKCTDTEFLDALSDQTYRDKIICTNLYDSGVTDLGEIRTQGFFEPGTSTSYINNYTRQGYAPTLTFNDKALTLAKYPNEGYLYTETILKASGSSPYSYLRKTEFTLADKRYRNWSGKDVWAVGYFNYDWCDSTAPAEFTENDTIISYTVYSAVANRRVRFFNIPEEMDMPGEYYLDRETGMLYLIPTDEMKQYHSLTYNSYDKNFFEISNAENITISGIRLSGTCRMAVYATNCDGIVLDNCELSAIGNAAVYLYKCYRSGVKNSHLHDLGSWGVFINQCGDRKTLTSGECFVTNTHIETFSQYRRTYSPAIQLYNDVGAKITNNEIHDAPHFAIRYEGNDILFEYNNIYDVCQDTSDTGAIYTGRRYDTFGNVIRYNYFHDMIAINSTTGMKTQAIYLDDMSASTSVFGNVFYKVDAVALYGGGSYNTFCNNIMIDCPQPLWLDARGINWGWSDSEHRYWLGTVDYKNGIWAEKYPEIQALVNNNPKMPQNNLLENNVYYKTPEFRIDSPADQQSTIRNNGTIAGTNSFADFKNQNFTVLPNSEIYKKVPGFQPIPFSRIGCYSYTSPENYEPVMYRRHTADKALSVSKTENGYSFETSDKTPFTLGIFSPEYKTEGGIKTMTDVSVSFITVEKNAEAEAEESDIIISMDNIEPVK